MVCYPSRRVEMAHGDLNVLVFGASLRQGSLNTTLAELAARAAEEAGAIVDRASLRDFDAPSYDGDDEKAGRIPGGIHELSTTLS
jgi:NAD(P)H-dependent FMN reductase